MKKESLVYSDLSKKELENLKEFYIKKKVESMSHQKLKEFVLEVISHQITNTIGKEEETEVWNEMSEFFGDQFEIITLDIKSKFKDDKNLKDSETDPHKLRQELLERNKLDKYKKDMWDD